MGADLGPGWSGGGLWNGDVRRGWPESAEAGYQGLTSEMIGYVLVPRHDGGIGTSRNNRDGDKQVIAVPIAAGRDAFPPGIEDRSARHGKWGDCGV